MAGFSFMHIGMLKIPYGIAVAGEAGMLYYNTWNRIGSCKKLPVLLEC
jgi:hypothetical protein